MSATSKPAPPKPAGPGPKPGGPAGPTPTGPAPGRALLDETARNLRAAVARLQQPARRDVPTDVAPTGGPVRTTCGSDGGEGGSFTLPRPPRLTFDPGAERLYGRVSLARPQT